MKTVLTLFHRKTVARECEILIKSTAQNSSGASHHTCVNKLVIANGEIIFDKVELDMNLSTKHLHNFPLIFTDFQLLTYF